MEQIKGHISQIIGPVIDVYFDTKGVDPEKVLPKIYDALSIKRPDGRDLIIEVQQHIGEDTVRCVAMDNTDGLQRGLEVVSTGRPILMPAGEQIKGRMMNVIGQPIDGMKPLDMKGAYPIHREAPKFDELSTHKEMLATGIKVIDLLDEYEKLTPANIYNLLDDYSQVRAMIAERAGDADYVIVQYNVDNLLSAPKFESVSNLGKWLGND